MSGTFAAASVFRSMRRIPDRFGDYRTCRFMSTRSLDSKFLQSSVVYMTLRDSVTPTEKNEAYGLFQRAAKGQNMTPQPSQQDKLAEWEAWSKLGEISEVEAKEKYVNLINQIMVRSGRNQIA